jgi:hypothetical protein
MPGSHYGYSRSEIQEVVSVYVLYNGSLAALNY